MSAWLPSAPCTPEDCVRPATSTVPVPLRLLRCITGLTVLAVGISLGPLVRRLPRAQRERLVRVWSRAVAAGFGVRIRSGGDRAAGRGGALLVANHVSWLDIALVAAVRPGRMLAKTEVGAWPVLGGLVARSGTLFIERDRLRSLPGTVEQIAAALRRGERVVVFPEGSTWCGRGAGRFRPALFQAAIDAGVPVLPVTIRYRTAGGEPTTVSAFVGDDGLLASVRRVVAARGLVGEVTVLPPITPGTHPGRRALADAAQAAVTGSGPAVREYHLAAAGPHRHPTGERRAATAGRGSRWS
ncbi:lysophospholipid acyltransferase family protein [Kitasatospora sp. NPDC094015]|uniref:lysophospholipid acyltransferase family protein n=1 Tax=Kitasatospora sp. NPDC094015 TaxID=3155205 RepID=UPI0033282C7A